MLYGIDISGWQTGINPAAVPSDFVIVKATGGTDYVNPDCDRTFQASRNAGRLTGIYHFAREAYCKGSAATEAQHFIEHTRGYHDGKTLLILDWEGDNTHDVAWALTWLEIVERATGIKPLIYMSQSVENAYNWGRVVAGDYGLWLAQYPTTAPVHGHKPPSMHGRLAHWPFAAIWQYSSSGRLSGWDGNLDLNVFYGDSAAWLKYAQKKGVAAPAPAPSGKWIEKGTRGTNVLNLQRGLNTVFPAYSDLAEDGIYGAATESVVKEFQTRTGIYPDGVVGPKTLASLKSYGVYTWL